LKTRRTQILVAASIVSLSLLGNPENLSADAPAESGHSHLGLFVGAGTEDSGSATHSARAAGLVYEYKPGNGWDLGGVLELLEAHNHTNTVAVLVAGYTFANGVRLFGGPGYEFKDDPRKDKWLLRAGLGYEFHLSDRWTLSPEAYVDVLDNSDAVWIAGLVLGYGF